MNESLSVKILHAFGGLQCHFDDFLRGESSGGSFAAQLAPQQESLHISVARVRVQQERSASVLDGDTEYRKQCRMTEPVEG